MLRMRWGLAGLLAIGLGVGSSAFAQDEDGDGVLNGADTYPCNAALAGEAFAPAEGTYGTLLFEDEWPLANDLDVNDLVLDYNYHLTTDAAGNAVALTVRYHVAALGGANPLGLGLHLPVPASAMAAATITDSFGTRNLVHEPLEAEATYEVASDLAALFAGATPPFNVVAGQPTVPGQSIVLSFSFAVPVALSMSAAPFDVYIFHVGQTRRETHRPNYAGTSMMFSSMFGTGVDGSGNGRYFVDTQGLPFVLDVPEGAAYPQEATHVAQLWPNISAFGASGGTTNQDFYTSAQTAQGYSGRVSAPAISISTPDVSCVPTGAYPDPAGFNTLWHVATYGDDATGDGSLANPFASVHVAINAASSGDGIEIHPGTYRLVPQVHYAGYMVAGIYDQRKRLSIYGYNAQTILEMHSADNGTHRDAHVLSFKGVETINGVNYGSVLSNVMVHFYPNRGRNYSDAIVGWNSRGAEIRNVVFENKSTTHSWGYVYDNSAPYDTPRIYNSAFISNSRWVSRYTGRPSFINCVMENAPNGYTTRTNNVYRRPVGADISGGAIPADLLNAGSPAITNPDGSRSHIGVRGGTFAWP